MAQVGVRRLAIPPLRRIRMIVVEHLLEAHL
jgi:hypothetical protein